MAHVIAPNYGEQFLFPPALEDFVPGDHPARFLREFVDELDLPALGFVTPAAVEGRPPLCPKSAFEDLVIRLPQQGPIDSQIGGDLQRASFPGVVNWNDCA